MKAPTVVRIRTSALTLAMLLGGSAWAAGKLEAAPDAGLRHPQVLRASSGCQPAQAPEAVLFSAVMQPSQPSCKPAEDSQPNNARAPQHVQRPLSGPPLFRRVDAVRYTF